MESHPDESLLSIDELSRVFTIRQGLATTRLVAVDRATLAIRAEVPEIVAIAGESGSGKTTLARMVLGLVEPSAGRICFRSRDVSKLTTKERRSWFMKEVQPVFQDPYATFSPLNRIDSYLYATALNYGMTSHDTADRYVDEKLAAVGLSLQEIRGRYPGELSGGQVQRISVARALMTNPSLLVADEPVSMLDASLRMSVVNLFKDLKDQRGITVIYITHDLATAYYCADRIAIMLRGQIVEMGPVVQVLGDPLHPYTQALKASIAEADPDRKWPDRTILAGVEREEYLRVGCKFAGRCTEVSDTCLRGQPEEIYLDGRMVRCFQYAETMRTTGGPGQHTDGSGDAG